MIRVGIVDDEGETIHRITDCLSSCLTEEHEIVSFSNGLSFLEAATASAFDLVLLDIDMPDINGFEIAERLRTITPDARLVFVSNFEHFVFQSFDYKPLRFVRKSNLSEDIRTAIEVYTKESRIEKDVYFFSTKEKDQAILLKNILFFECQRHDIFVQTTDGRLKLRREGENEKTISSIYEELKTKGFIRVHKSFLVNFRFIYIINRNSIQLKDGHEIYINPHNVNEIKKMYQRFLMMEV